MYNLVEDINKIMDKYEIWPDLKFKAKNVINDGEATDTNDVVNNYKLIGDNIIFDNKPFNYDEMIRDLIFEIYGYAMGKNRQNSQLFIDPYVDHKDTVIILYDIMSYVIEQIKKNPKYSNNKKFKPFMDKVKNLKERCIKEVDEIIVKKREICNETFINNLTQIAIDYFNDINIYPHFKFQFDGRYKKNSFMGINNVNFYNKTSKPQQYNGLLKAMILNVCDILSLTDDDIQNKINLIEKLNQFLKEAIKYNKNLKINIREYNRNIDDLCGKMKDFIKQRYCQDQYSGKTIDDILHEWNNEAKEEKTKSKAEEPQKKKGNNKKRHKKNIPHKTDDKKYDNLNTINISNSKNTTEEDKNIQEEYQEVDSLPDIIPRIQALIKNIPAKDPKKQNSWGLDCHYCKGLDNYTYMEKVHENLQNILEKYNINIQKITSKRRDTIEKFNCLRSAVKKSRAEEDFDNMSIDTRQFYKDNKFNPYKIDFNDIKGNITEHDLKNNLNGNTTEYGLNDDFDNNIMKYYQYDEEEEDEKEINNNDKQKSLDSQKEEGKKI